MSQLPLLILHFLEHPAARWQVIIATILVAGVCALMHNGG